MLDLQGCWVMLGRECRFRMNCRKVPGLQVLDQFQEDLHFEGTIYRCERQGKRYGRKEKVLGCPTEILLLCNYCP